MTDATAPPALPEAPASIRIFVAFLVARGVFGLALLGASLRRFPILWYYPLQRRWAFEVAPQGLGMGWYGATLFALAVALASGAFVVAAFRSRVIASVLANRSNVLAIARAGGLVVIVDFVYFGWVLTHQTPAPLPVDCR